jgi:hypothetical protein
MPIPREDHTPSPEVASNEFLVDWRISETVSRPAASASASSPAAAFFTKPIFRQRVHTTCLWVWVAPGMTKDARHHNREAVGIWLAHLLGNDFRRRQSHECGRVESGLGHKHCLSSLVKTEISLGALQARQALGPTYLGRLCLAHLLQALAVLREDPSAQHKQNRPLGIQLFQLPQESKEAAHFHLRVFKARSM